MDITNTVFNTEKLKNKYNRSLSIALVIFQFVGILLAVLVNEKITDRTILTSFAFIIISLVGSYILSKTTRGDYNLIHIFNLLYTIGLITLIRLDDAIAFKHVIWYCAGLIAYICVYHFMRLFESAIKGKFWIFFSITLASFILTLTLGFTSGGAKNWINIGGFFTLQLSEFAKISYIFMIASYYHNYNKFSDKKFGKYYLLFSTYVFSALFFLQADLGTAVLLFVVMLASMFIFERRYLFILLNIGLMLIGILLASLVLNHIKVRIEIWLDPWKDANNRGYQIIQGMFAIANGGFFGAGIGLGEPDLVPVVETDYIFTAVIEEMGIFMGFAILMVYILLFYKAIKTSLELKSNYYSSLALSIGLLFSVQTLIIVGGILKLIPLTGVTTPFLSYGGSSTLVSFILLAILQYLTTKTGDNYEQVKK